MYFYSGFHTTKNDLSNISNVLKSGIVSSGKILNKFRTENEKITTSNCILTNSGTSSLLAAFNALEIKTNSIIWTSALNFCATAQVGIFLGAKVEFLDVDDKDFNIDISILKKNLKEAELTNSLPDLIVIVHLGGVLQDMEAINNLSKIYNFKVLEDACHAYGSFYPNGKPLGSSFYSDITIFSFHGLKTISTGEGGLICTSNMKLFERISNFVNLGLKRNNKSEPWLVEASSYGMNLRMSDINAALGLSQLEDLERRKEIRINQLKYYSLKHNKELMYLQGSDPQLTSEFRHLIIFKFHCIKNMKDKLSFYQNCLNEGVRLSCHYKPTTCHEIFRNKKNKFKLDEAENYYLKSFTIPSSFNMEIKDLEKVLNIISRVAKEIENR